jgi:hypothetical protein
MTVIKKITTCPSDAVKDEVWLALMGSLSAHTALLRFLAGEENIDRTEAMRLSADAIKQIVGTLDTFNL